MIESFIDSLTEYTRATDNFDYGTQVYTKGNSLKKKWISLNRLYKSFIVIDIDEPQSTFRYEERNLPTPSIITINPKNGKCHYLYKLNTPVIYTEEGRRRPQSFYEAVDISLTKALGGDLCYIGRMTKNPLHPDWKVIQHNVQYDLNDFQEYLDIRTPRKIEVVPGEGRNCTLFDSTRFWAYVEVKLHTNFLQFMDAVEKKAQELNNSLFSDYERGVLSYKEVLHVAKSIGTWTWRHRFDIGRKCNRGVMADQFEPQTPLVVKQMLSADRTNEVRKQSSLNKILSSAAALNAQGTPITQQSIAVHSGVSLLTVKRKWNVLSQQFNLYTN